MQDIAERAAALRAEQVSALSSAGAAGRQPPPHSPSTAGAEVAGDGVVSPVAAGGGANTHPPVGAAPVIGGVPVGALAQVAVSPVVRAEQDASNASEANELAAVLATPADTRSQGGETKDSPPTELSTQKAEYP